MGRIANIDSYAPIDVDEPDFVAISEDEACPVDYASDYDADDEQSSLERSSIEFEDEDEHEDTDTTPTTPRSGQSSSWNPLSRNWCLDNLKGTRRSPGLFSPKGEQCVAHNVTEAMLGVSRCIWGTDRSSSCESTPSENSSTSRKWLNGVLESSPMPATHEREDREDYQHFGNRKPLYQPPPLLPEEGNAILVGGALGNGDAVVDDDWAIVEGDEPEVNRHEITSAKVSKHGDPNNSGIRLTMRSTKQRIAIVRMTTSTSATSTSTSGRSSRVPNLPLTRSILYM